MSALDEWQRGVESLAKLLDAALWSSERLAAARRELACVSSTSWPERRAVVLDEQFALLEVLATSPRATVFAGLELTTGADIAIKVLLPTPGFAIHRRELERERELLSRLRHDHVVEMRGHGCAGTLPYLVTGRMLGGSLDAWLGRAPSKSERLQVLRDASSGLAAAASLDLAHGDVKPQNVLVSREGRGRLCDWGSERYTTVLFSPPERRVSTPPSPAGDVFSLGLVIAFALRGWHETPAPNERADPNIWPVLATRGVDEPGLVELIARCVDPNPRARPSARRVAQMLAPPPSALV
ncbi:Serine/threonine-protein kinase PrkC [Enhygromyxa salina]|uniref:Serine/threonine-protein kinase PrkC n=1 Tax=Enhygromyxa salina TaxID=215803 RepID=A0A2S9XEL2_9BACT|nr:protein kinase [Enhygromyxa salina]PRP91111.1 Serine/threonine-protein kinase PrkC [Enhygromyxa salina]